MHNFSMHETCLSILTTISCNFQFMNTHTHIYIECDFYFVYKITKDYNFLQGNLIKKNFIHRQLGDLNHEYLYWKLKCQPIKLQDS